MVSKSYINMQILVPPELKMALRKVAERNGVSLSDVARIVILGCTELKFPGFQDTLEECKRQLLHDSMIEDYVERIK